NERDNKLGVLLGNGDGSFQTQLTFDSGGRPYSVAAADVNGDGRLDLVAANFQDAAVSVLLNATPTFTIDHTAPTVTITRGNPAGANTTNKTVTFTATFSEPVTGVDAGDFWL